MKKILLTQNQKTIIDDEDYEKVNQFKWCADYKKSNKSYYAYSNINGKGIRLHRFIMNNPVNMQVDHINNNTLDNRKSNLRICTNQQNICNQKIHTNNTSGYKGVVIFKSCKYKKWHAQIMINRKHIGLGFYHTSKEAAISYNKAALKYFGEFAYLNKV